MNQKFKRTLVSLILGISVQLMQAYDIEIDGIYYDIDTVNHTAEVVGAYNDDNHINIIIPSQLEYLSTIYRVTSIGQRAFFSHYSLESVTIPNSVNNIGSNAFTYCLSLQIVNIPNSVNFIGYGAFSSCSSLQNIEIPNSVSLISEWAFYNCISLQTVEIPNSITTIKYNTFAGCTSLTQVKIPDSVLTIEENAFHSCSSLSIINIPNTVQFIGTFAFYGCSSIRKLEIPNSLTSIEESTFQNCSSLQHIEIPVSITSIGKKAFAECYSLKGIICKAVDPPICGFDPFQWINYDNCILFVPDQSINLYQDADFWKAFFNVRGLSQYEESIEADNIILNTEEIEIYIGETFQLEATVLPEGTTDFTITWNSSNEVVAIVSEDGLLTAINEGTTTITATCGKVSATCEVAVLNPIVEAQEIFLNIEKAEINKGETLQLTVTIFPENTTDTAVIWSSSNEKVATVSEEGLITAISEGTAIITAICGEVSATCEVIVVNPVIEAEQITLNLESVELNIGETIQLEATVLPEDTSNLTVIWNSSDENIALVSETGLVTAIEEGSTIITAKCGEVAAECTITVLDDAGVESLWANPDSKISVYSIDGVLIKKDCKVEDLKSITKGIYIIVSGKDSYKISI